VTSSTGSYKVLLIEDNQDFVYLLSEILESMGHSCVAAFDGADGIKKAQEIKPDVILCDIGLPHMNGFEVAKKLKEDHSLKDIYLVALTGYVSARDMYHAAAAGFDFHLAKPVNIADMNQVLEKIHKARNHVFEAS
jgi:CheY-like chemotaxis protein